MKQTINSRVQILFLPDTCRPRSSGGPPTYLSCLLVSLLCYPQFPDLHELLRSIAYLTLVGEGAVVSLHVGRAERGLEGGVVGVGRQWLAAPSPSSSRHGVRPVAVDVVAEVGQGLLQLTDAVRVVAARPILALTEL